MKKLFRIIIAVIALLSVTTSVAFMTPTADKQEQQKQQLEQQQKKDKKKQNKKKIQPKQTVQQPVDMFSSLRDDAGILSVNDKKEIMSLIKETEAKHKIRCAVVITSNLNNMEIGKYANSLIDKYYTDGEKGNVVLVIDPKKRKYYFSLENKMRQAITDGDKHGVGYVKEAFQPLLKENKWADASKAFVKRVDEMCTYYEKEGKGYDPADKFNFIAAIIAAVVAAIAAWGMRQHLIASMSNVAPAKTAREYLVKESIAIKENQDIYLYTTTTVTHHEKSSSDNSSTDSSHGGGGGSF